MIEAGRAKQMELKPLMFCRKQNADADHENRLSAFLLPGRTAWRNRAPDTIGAHRASFRKDAGHTWLSFEKSTTGQACADLAPDGTLIIRYHTITQAMRLLGDALAGTLRPGAVCKTPFRTLGIMIDCSRCAVPRTETVFSTIERLALLGYNRLLLYTEDVYTLPGEPYFGLQRGRYTAEEIRAFDDCAADFGVELVPCFQTLAHLDQMFGWPHYSDIRDLNGVMLVGEEKVYALIEKMMQFWTQNVRTRTFHIGMDEAWGIGTGEYRKRYGEKPAFDILLDHIARVSEICDRYGVKPIMWSDVWFRAASPKGDYYDPCEIPAAVAEKIPENLQLCYWDYCHTDKAFYIDYIRRHQALHGEPSLAASIWTSNLLWFASTHTMARLIPCMEAGMETGLQDLFFCEWGDDGGFCDFESAFSGKLYAADLAYGAPTDPQTLEKRYAMLCDGASFEAVFAVGDVCTWHCHWLLYDDPLMNMLARNLSAQPLSDADPTSNLCHLRDRALATLKKLDALPERRSLRGGSIPLARAIFSALCARIALAESLLRDDPAARDGGDRSALAGVPALIENAIAAMEALMTEHRRMWMTRNRPQGMERIQIRFAGILERLRETERRVNGFLSGETDCIPELDETLSFEKGPRLNAGYARLSHSAVV